MKNPHHRVLNSAPNRAPNASTGCVARRALPLQVSIFLGMLLLAGCGVIAGTISPDSDVLDQLERERRHIQALVELKSGSDVHPALVEESVGVLSEIAQRLLHDTPAWSVVIDVVPDDRVLAFSYGPAGADRSGVRGLVFSTGLVKRLNTEVQMAFVVAHEIAHGMLAHAAADHGYSLAEELAADRRALALLAGASYDIRHAPGALVALPAEAHRKPGSAPQATEDRLSGGLFDVAVRTERLREQIIESKWQPPGTISLVRYQELRNALLETSR